MRTTDVGRVLLLALTCASFLHPSLGAAQSMAPLADPRAVVVSGEARFTVLAPRMIRMEWSATKQFEDRASLVFINRRQSVPSFKVGTRQGWVTITTDSLTLRYRPSSGAFTEKNLSVEFNLDGKPTIWRPGMEDTGNLRGTTRTLDGVNGPSNIEPGLVSRNGWVVVDDTERLIYDTSDWAWVTARPAGRRQDWYVLGYGRDYRGALSDFTKVAGKIPMPPRFAFGAWWSRYWAYTDQEFKDLAREFEIHSVPLDVLVVDMDWHQTFGGAWGNEKDQSGHTKGWTGFTWDRNYFPDPEGFLTWVGDRGLRTPLNLHPASGLQPWEDQYPSIARAMGIDPATNQFVPFDIVDKKFATSFFDLVIHPLEKQGVDFWWLDWQQSDKTKLEGINPTWWLNYTFFTDMERQGKHRPLIFHRWGGLGNHRYQVGFSGDTYSTWPSLAFQPYFTATAANVGFGYWSHDIGGHMNGPVQPELYARWIQFGAFSPILRTHTTKNPDAERRIWAYAPEFFKPMRDAFLLRYAMIPYIYTASRQTYDTGVPFLRPMYYDSPSAEEAYAFKDQYLFGDSLIVAPIVRERAKETGLAAQSVWLPEGSWIEWFSGARFEGPRTIERSFSLEEIPIYVKAGSIIPMQPPMRRSDERPLDPLILTVFPGADRAARVYEDQGDSIGYQKGECAWTPVRHVTAADGTRVIEVLAAEGTYPGMLAQRGYEVRLRGTLPPKQIVVGGRAALLVDPDARARQFKEPGSLAGPHWWFDGEAMTTHIAVPSSAVTSAIEIRVTPSRPPIELSWLIDGFPGLQRRLHDLHNLVNRGWPKAIPPDVLLNLVQTGNRMSSKPAEAIDELTALNNALPALEAAVAKIVMTPEARTQASALLQAMRK
jgi:alpha-glucosidase (family GH31 glycosyl hydrolase)